MVDINARIAARVRELRERSALSLEALAGKCDVSRSMISLIERGETSPTAVVLDKIATGARRDARHAVRRRGCRASPVSHRCRSHRVEGSAVRLREAQYLARQLPLAHSASSRCSSPPARKVAYETSARDVGGHQQIWVQDGAIEVTVGSTHQLGKDDCLAMQLDAPITFRNRTRKPARYLVVLSS